MKVLLDTHVFLWWNQDSPQLSEKARELIADGRSTLFLSAASAWEIAIKWAKRRLTLPEPADRYITARMEKNRITALPVEISHALAIVHLPSIHQDPFDRLLVAQGRLEKLPILTADPILASYPVEIIW